MKARAPSQAARVFAALLMARAVYGLAYLGITLARWPVPWYYPLEHRWEIVGKPAGFAMGWFGATAAALVAALPNGRTASLEGQEHNVDPTVLGPAIREFLAS